MALLNIPAQSRQIQNPGEIKTFLNDRGVFFDQWTCDVEFVDNASQEEIIAAYGSSLDPFMTKGKYTTADVISIHSQTENYLEIRKKFLAEHTHTEDEIRFFVDGEGLFWFHLDNDEIFNVLCQKGDLISVPAGCKHWFDAGETNPHVKAIRIFLDASGWVPHYTHSAVEQQFLVSKK
ncbi:MAG: 1,2-dihydroxy-3-keto-5-methylthiopentene dioxygenase [Psychromonas sp.]|jgi:1,2-dihydroxy-3-keto-5-methylthiopentene dioxygenase